MWCHLRTVGYQDSDGILWIVEIPYENLPTKNSSGPYILVEAEAELKWEQGTPIITTGLVFSARHQAGWEDYERKN